MKKMTYEAAIIRLEEIVHLLESGEASLEDSLKLYEEGTKLTSFCYESLNKAEQKVIELSELEKSEKE